LRFVAPEGVTGVRLRDPQGDERAEFDVHEGQVEARVNLGEYVLEWART
jgi:hypothetical protein